MTGSVVHLPNDLRQQIVDHCRSALPNEGCGMLALDNDHVAKVYPTGNDDDSPVSYTVPPQEHFDALTDAEANGWRLDGVFHSHPNGPDGLSGTDMARLTDPQWIYLVVSLAGPEPTTTAWRDGRQVEIVP